MVQLVFEQFDRLGTMNAVLRFLVANRIRLPVRPASGPSKGQLEWRSPNQSCSRNLSHPVYAGAYVYGRSRQGTKARHQKLSHRVARSEWLVLLRDRHPAYISWEQYEANQDRWRRTAPATFPDAACARGPRLARRASSSVPVANADCVPSTVVPPTIRAYNCSANRTLYGDPHCQALVAQPLDDEVVRLTLTALQPSALEVSLQVASDIHKQREDAEAIGGSVRARHLRGRARRPSIPHC